MHNHMQAFEIELHTPVKLGGKNWIVHGREENGDVRLQTDYPHAEAYVGVKADHDLELGSHTFDEKETAEMENEAARVEQARSAQCRPNRGY